MKSASHGYLYLKLVSYCGLALSIVPAVLVFTGTFEKATYLSLLILGMVMWFSSAIFWIRPDQHQQEEEKEG